MMNTSRVQVIGLLAGFLALGFAIGVTMAVYGSSIASFGTVSAAATAFVAAVIGFLAPPKIQSMLGGTTGGHAPLENLNVGVAGWVAFCFALGYLLGLGCSGPWKPAPVPPLAMTWEKGEPVSIEALLAWVPIEQKLRSQGYDDLKLQPVFQLFRAQVIEPHSALDLARLRYLQQLLTFSPPPENPVAAPSNAAPSN